QDKMDGCFADWKEREAVAEAMIPLIGRLYRQNNVITSIYGRAIINRSVIGIMKAHRFVRQVANSELSVLDTYPILKILDQLNLGAASIGVGKLAVKCAQEGGDRTLEEFVRDEVAEVVANYDAERRQADLRQTKDVVLYGFG